MKITPIILKGELEGGEAPEMIQIIPLGSWTDHPSGKFRVTKADVVKIIENFAQEENDCVIDYEHQTLHGTEAPAAGWIRELINKEDEGLYAKVEWTKRGKEYIENKEYKYLSPVLLSSHQDEEGWNRPHVLHSAALTNKPFIDGMEPIVNKNYNFGMKEEEEMNKEELIKVLGLKEDATEEEVMTALKDLQSGNNQVGNGETGEGGESQEETKIVNSKVLDALDLEEGASQSEIVATIHALKQSTVTGVSVEEFNKLKQEMQRSKRDELVQLAMKEGKITPAQKEWAKSYAEDDPEGFKTFINKAPQVVPVDDGEEFDLKTKTKSQTSEVQTIVNKQLGISEEDFEKYGDSE
ncbi:phage protease [Halanaerocella petrolearia]